MTLHAYFTDIYLKKPQTYETFFLDWQPLKDFVYLTKKKKSPMQITAFKPSMTKNYINHHTDVHCC